MKKLNLKRYFEGFDNIIRSLLIISLSLFFLTFFIFEEMAKWNYTTYVPAAALVVLCVIYYVKKKIAPNVKPLIPIYVFVGIAYFVSLIANPIAALTYKTLLVLAFFATTIYLSCFIIKDTKAILWAMLLGGLIYCASYFGVYCIDILKLNLTSGLGKAFGDCNNVGLKLCVVAALLGAVCAYSKRYWAFVFMLPLCVFIIATSSATAFIQMLVIIIYIIFVVLRKRIKWAIIVSASLILFIFGAVYFLPSLETLKQEFIVSIAELFAGRASDADGYARLFYRDNAFALSFKSLLIGYGPNGFQGATGMSSRSCNNITELLCGFGIFGVISFYAIFVTTAKGLFKCRKEPGTVSGLYIPLLAIVLTSLWFVSFDQTITFVLFAVCAYVNQNTKPEPQSHFVLKASENIETAQTPFNTEQATLEKNGD
jgi:O-antigen ligase